MSVIGRCVKTGARVLLVEYGRVVAADVFASGDQLVISFHSGDLYANSADPDDCTPTHTVSVTGGFYHQAKGLIVVDRQAFTGRLVE